MLVKPVIEVPGKTPRSPHSVVEPVLVTVEAPKTEKLCAAPRIGDANAGAAAESMAMTASDSVDKILAVFIICTPK